MGILCLSKINFKFKALSKAKSMLFLIFMTFSAIVYTLLRPYIGIYVRKNKISHHKIEKLVVNKNVC